MGDGHPAYLILGKNPDTGAYEVVSVKGGKLQIDSELTVDIDPTGLATQATLSDILAKLSSDPATQTTLAAILAKIIAAPATEAKQTALQALIGEVQASPTENTVLDRLKDLLTGISLATGANTIGKVGVNRSVQLHANIDFSSASAQTIIAAPAAGNRIRLCQLVLISGAASPVNSEVAIKSGSTTIKTVKGSSVVLDFPEHCNLGTAEALVLQATTADRVIGGVDYYVEAV